MLLKLNLKEIQKHTVIFTISILLAFTWILPRSVSAADGSSFSTCENRTQLKLLYVTKNGRTYGTFKVFKCTGHYFARVSNTIGSPRSTVAWIKREHSSQALSRMIWSEVQGRYDSITYLIRDPSGYQCFEAWGSITTDDYGVAGKGYSWCS